jgi:large subunit ribosomal protein L25
MDKIKLTAKARTVSGRKVKKLRKLGLLPANVFGKKMDSIAIELPVTTFKEVFEKAGETGLIDLTIENGKVQNKAVLISNLQFNPLTDEPLHVDFRAVDLTEKITAHVPVELEGESPAEQQGLGTVVLYYDEIEVEALPSDFPEKFVVDSTKLSEVEQTVFIKDLSYDSKKVTIITDVEGVLAKVEPPQKEEEPVVAPAAEGEVPAEGAETPPEGSATTETPAEGEAPKA